jgi:release factor glutamine methyltransferase
MKLRLSLPSIGEILKEYPKQLDNRFGSAKRDVEDILMHILKCNEAHLMAYAEQKLRSIQYAKFKLMMEKRKRGMPLQYIFKKATFYNIPLRVTPSVLIPRPETELLVDQVRDYVTNHQIRNVVDIGTGPGTIIIALAKQLDKEKDYFFIGTDSSVQAISLARLNALKNKAHVHYYTRDFIKNPYTFIPMTSWVMVSNPPYLTEEELSEPSIQFEPRLALYGGKDGLDAYRILIEQVSKLENKPKAIFFEIGYKQAEAIKQLANQSLKPQSIEVFQDFCGKDRVVKIEL